MQCPSLIQISVVDRSDNRKHNWFLHQCSVVTKPSPIRLFFLTPSISLEPLDRSPYSRRDSVYKLCWKSSSIDQVLHRWWNKVHDTPRSNSDSRVNTNTDVRYLNEKHSIDDHWEREKFTHEDTFPTIQYFPQENQWNCMELEQCHWTDRRQHVDRPLREKNRSERFHRRNFYLEQWQCVRIGRSQIESWSIWKVKTKKMHLSLSLSLSLAPIGQTDTCLSNQ